MGDETVQRFYDFHARIYDWTRRPFLPDRAEAVDALALRAGQAVLEIGCGTGANLARLAAAVGDTGRVVGIDFSEPMLERARRRAARHGWQQVTLVKADATSAKLAWVFDGVLFAYSLAMIPAWTEAIARAAAMLRPGGRFAAVEFGRFERWGPARRLVIRWLAWHHCHVDRDYAAEMCCHLEDVRLIRRRGGYDILLSGQKPASEPRP